MSGMSFLNALRLHKDSIFMYKNKSFPTAFQLSIIAQEEIGKSNLLEDVVFQMFDNPKGINPEYEKMIVDLLYSHKDKQIRFSSKVEDEFTKRYFKIAENINSGKYDEKKQNATYVGLTKKQGKKRLNGKILNPIMSIKGVDAAVMITKVNDYVIELIEGVRRGIYSVDTEELDESLTLEAAQELESLWPNKSISSIKRLKKIREFDIDPDSTY